MNDIRSTTTWVDEGEDDHELVRELLDDESPLFFLPDETVIETNPSPACEQPINDQQVSTLYSGPAIQDKENALSITSQKDHLQAASQARFSMVERSLSKFEDSKYTLKLKCCGNGMADDGYKWRKYGQKSIKNSPYPRSYYRCTSPRCSAKKQVERSREDDDTILVTYEGLHLHFVYPYFLLSQPPPQHISPPPPMKKPKMKTPSESASSQAGGTEKTQPETTSRFYQAIASNDDQPQEPSLERTGSPQGLLEDVVPLMVRNPSNNLAYSSTSSCSSHRSSPTSQSSLFWPPNDTYSLY